MASDDAIITAAQLDGQARYYTATSTAATAAQAQRDVATIEANAQREVAQSDAQSRGQVAQTQAQSAGQVAQTEAQGRNQVATTEAQSRNQVAQTEAAATTSVANTRAQADTSVAGINRDAQIAAAQIDASWHANVATIQAKATTDAATIDASWHQGVAEIESNAKIQAAQIDASWHQGVADTEAAASNYRADQELAGVNAHETHEDGRLTTKLAFAEGKFSTVWPTVEGFIGTVGGSFQLPGGPQFTEPSPSTPIGFRMGPNETSVPQNQLGTYQRRGEMWMGSGDVKTQGIGFASGTSVSDAVAATQLPFISTSGVLTQAQIQQKVNQLRARADVKTQTESRKIMSDLTGRGFSASSPVVSALQASIAAQGLRTSIEGATDLMLKAAEVNADAVLKGQIAVADQWNKEEQALIDVAKNQTTRVVGVLSAITGMVGSIA